MSTLLRRSSYLARNRRIVPPACRNNAEVRTICNNGTVCSALGSNAATHHAMPSNYFNCLEGISYRTSSNFGNNSSNLHSNNLDTNHRFFHATSTPRHSNSDKSPSERLLKSRGDEGNKNSGQYSRNHVLRPYGTDFSNNNNTVNESEESEFENWYEDNDGEYFDQNEDDTLKVWHESKHDEYHKLFSKAKVLLNSPPKEQKDVEEILSLMLHWNEFVSNITPEMHALNKFRSKNPQYPPSDLIMTISHNAAENTRILLTHLLTTSELKLSPGMEVNAYKLAMSVWSHVFHPRSGDKCEEILEEYGDRFGGDMNYMPSLDAYHTVLEAHKNSCSSYFLSKERGGEGNHFKKDDTPGEKALGLLRLLTDVYTAGDMFLKPDVKMYSNTIAVLRNTLLDWKDRRRINDVGRKLELEVELAVEACSALEQMNLQLLEEIQDKSNEKSGEKSLDRWYCAIRAHVDCLAIVSRIRIGNDVNIKYKTTAAILKKLENFISAHSASIAKSVDENGFNDSITHHLVDGMQQSIEEAYGNAISSDLNLSREHRGFADFGNALMNASASETIFQQMKKQAQESPPGVQFLFPSPTSDHYKALVQCWCECLRGKYSTPDSNLIMEKLGIFPHSKALILLNELGTETPDSQPIDGTIPSGVIWAWSQVPHWPALYEKKKNGDAAASAAERILKRTMERYDEGSVVFAWNGSVTKMYNFVFGLYACIFREGSKKSTKRSMALLDDMESYYENSNGLIAKPDGVTFGFLLKTIGNSGLQSSGSTAESLLIRMENSGVKPREKHYLAVIRAHLRVGQNDLDPRKANSILELVKKRYNKDKSVKPTTAIYSACIKAYAGFNNVPKVLELFEELKTLYKETEDPDFRPDQIIYSTVLDAISKPRVEDRSSARLALEILDEFEQSYDLGLVESVPNRYMYTNVLHAISRASLPNAELAESLVERMDNRARHLKDDSILPDVVTFTVLLQILSRSKRSDSAERAEKWFKEMEHRYENGDQKLKPNKKAYTALINCWWRSGRPEAGDEAEKILRLMEEKYAKGDIACKPDTFVYASTINAFGRCSSEDKALRIWDIYKRMKEKYSNGDMDLKPNHIIVSVSCLSSSADLINFTLIS